MPIHLVIQKKRKELGLTQEQVAHHLRVSSPAVSKWETGATIPDITLLPSLARLLKTDINTLLCFQEDLSEEEIRNICQEVQSILIKEGTLSGFAAAEAKYREYPHNETLLQGLTILLDGFLSYSEEDPAFCEDRIIQWYRQLTQSLDPGIQNSANFMLASRYIRNGFYGEAQEVLNQMPDKQDTLSAFADKQLLQITLWENTGNLENAEKVLQETLLSSATKDILLLSKLLYARLSCGDIVSATRISHVIQKLSETLELWDYHRYVSALQIAMAERSIPDALSALEGLAHSITHLWKPEETELFFRLSNASDPKLIISAILEDLERNPDYDFLRVEDRFQQILKQLAHIM